MTFFTSNLRGRLRPQTVFDWYLDFICQLKEAIVEERAVASMVVPMEPTEEIKRNQVQPATAANWGVMQTMTGHRFQQSAP